MNTHKLSRKVRFEVLICGLFLLFGLGIGILPRIVAHAEYGGTAAGRNGGYGEMMDNQPTPTEATDSTEPQPARFLEARAQDDKVTITLVNQESNTESVIAEEDLNSFWMPFFQKYMSTSPNDQFGIYITAANLSMEDTKIWIVDLESGEKRLLASFESGFWTAPIVWSPDSASLAIIKIDDASNLELWRIDAATGGSYLVTTDDSLQAYMFRMEAWQPVSWSEDSTKIIYTDHAQEDHNINYQVDINTGEITKTFSDKTAEDKTQATVLAALPCSVPLLGQNDSPWNSNIMQTCGSTLASQGCAITSVSMVFQYYGYGTNPGVLNSCLGNLACPIYWGNAATGCSGGKVTGGGLSAFAWSTLESELNSGHPPVIYMGCPSTTHTVVVVAGSGSTYGGYTINDPLDHSIKSFSNYSSCALTGGSYGIHMYYGTPTCSNCTGPSLNSPGDGYVSSSQTINFSWSAPSGCTFEGYTFRIKDTSNMDSGGNTIQDTGNSTTSRTETISSQWNNRDLYWGVRTANPLSPNWTVRRFRIEPGSGCNNNSDQVTFFSDANYGGSCVTKGVGDYTNPSAMGIANDSVSSVKVGGNVKVTLCKDDNYSGGCETLQGDDANLADNSVGDNQASSAKVETRVTACSPSSDQVAFYADANYGGSCVVKGIGNYSNPSGMEFGNDSLSSIRVGGNVKLTLCQDDNYSGTCEIFTGDDSNLGDNSIGDNQASSAKVENRVTAPDVPIPSSPGNGSTNPSNYDLTFQWNPSARANEYLIEWWGGPYSTMQPCGWGSSTTCPIGTVIPGNTYSWHVKAHNSAGESSWSDTWTFTVADQTTCPAITRWKGEYWANTTLTDPLGLCRDDQTIDFDWGTGSPGGSIPTDQFSGRWTRSLDFSAGNYIFHMRHDDGARLYIDNSLKIDAWSTCCLWETAQVSLTGGQHTIKVEMYENGGAANLGLWWEPATITGWRGEYYNNESLSGNPAIVRDDAAINFEWGSDPPDPMVLPDHFSVRWTKTISFTGGYYEFDLFRDDGIRLKIDGVTVLDRWTYGREWVSKMVKMSQGNHTIVVESFDIDGWASAELNYSPTTPYHSFLPLLIH